MEACQPGTSVTLIRSTPFWWLWVTTLICAGLEPESFKVAVAVPVAVPVPVPPEPVVNVATLEWGTE